MLDPQNTQSFLITRTGVAACREAGVLIENPIVQENCGGSLEEIVAAKL